MIYLFDTNAVVIGVQGARPRKSLKLQEEEASQAKFAAAFIAKRGKAELAISTVTLTEYVSWYPPDQQAAHAARLNEMFQVYPLDAITAELAARIRHATWGKEEIKQAYEKRRKCFFADCNIVATALTRKVGALVAYDGDAGKILARVKGTKPELITKFHHGDQRDAFEDLPPPKE